MPLPSLPPAAKAIVDEWRPVVSCEGYEVTAEGKVRSVDRVIMRSNGRPCPRRGKVLKPWIDPHGYYRIEVAGKRGIFVHVMVAEAFIGRKPEGMQVNHKDCNKQNNHVFNLEYVTPSENCKHAYDNGLFKLYRQRGSNHPNAKLTESDVVAMFHLRANGESQQSIGKKFGISQTIVGDILRRERWQHVTIEQE